MKKFSLAILLIFSTLLSAESTYDEQLDYIYSIRMNQTVEARELLDELSSSSSSFSKDELAKYYSLLAHSSAMQANYKESIVFSGKAINATDNIDLVSKAKSLKANALYLNGQYRKAFLETYDVLEKLNVINDINLKNDVLMNAVANHISAGIYDKAQTLSLQNLASAKTHNSDDMVCQSTYQLAAIKKSLKQYKLAKAESENALVFCKKTGNQLYILGLKEIIANAAFMQNNLVKAKKLYSSLYDVSKDFGWTVQLALIRTKLAEIYLEMDELSKVEEYAMPAYQYGKSKNDFQHLKAVSLVLAKFYKKTGDIKKAKFYNK